MFTGIVQGRGRIFEARAAGGGRVFGIEAGFDLTDPEEGESIAINGVCLTAREISGRRFYADVSPETLARTTHGELAPGHEVNLERALRLADRLGGHLVSGHVDGVGRVRGVEAAGDYTLFTFSMPRKLARYVVHKGSITIDGVSLTVNAVGEDWFAVSIIPHTLAVTTLGTLSQGSRVNLEVDIIGKYVEKLLAAGPAPEEEAGGINREFLAKYGFLR